MSGADAAGAGGLYPTPATPGAVGVPAGYPLPPPGAYYPPPPYAPGAAAGTPSAAAAGAPAAAAAGTPAAAAAWTPAAAAPRQRPLPATWTTRSEGVTCPGCGASVESKVTVKSCTMGNWVFCCFTCACCVFIPGMCDCASNVYHRCPNCAYMLGGRDLC
ncbi:hypothetical protein BU14_0574s0005 [Porphyra umbilicalis]|uniref:LITAF domain-containing protein n=1 Tax=Porphyra umbilicalis TaxID=2786 RepID=A0A1X6NRK2_PORUM|nr:hypothetical protein BU14_0574s0005 [Porphyra umbilicalis]|eukprot:OSX71234.1 hypothetical protein BU14_0574s0005 [Porphyra umbilicalis]